MNRPWMPLYIAEFIAETMHLGATETGIYMRLMMHCWQHGTIPLDSKKLALIGHCDSRLWRQYEKTVMAFFDVVDASTAQHKRVSTELRRSEEIYNKRKDASVQMHSKRRANGVHLHTQLQLQRKKDAGAREAEKGPLALSASRGLATEEWDVVCTTFKKFGRWSRHAGPEPSSPACQCPSDILEKHGLRKGVLQ